MRLRRFLVGLCTLAVVGVLSPITAVADSPAPAPSSAAQPDAPSSGEPAPSTKAGANARVSIGISPTRLVVSQRDIGTTQRMRVVNTGTGPAHVVIQKRNFTATPQGAMKYQEDAPYGAAEWVTVAPVDFTLAAGASQIVTADVQTPSEPEPGDHHVAIVFMIPSEDGPGAGNIKINRGVATPVFITAPGPVVDSVLLSGLRAPRFTAGGTVAIAATVTNNGTVHHDFRKPSPLTVQASGKAEPFPDFTVSRGAVRDVTTTWDPPFLCICRPTVTMTSANGGMQSESVRVIVFPWHLFAGTAAALLLLLLLTRLGRRRYHAQVLKAAALHNAGSSGDA